ncbi:MAG: hypothetical protein ACYTG2_04595 [Planctomycetota bacterium]|jgi:hypothetical protein
MRISALILATLALTCMSTVTVAQDGAAIRRANIKAQTERAVQLRHAKARSAKRFADWQRKAHALRKAQSTRAPVPGRKAVTKPGAARSMKSIEALRKRAKALEHSRAAAAAGTRRAKASRAPAKPASPKR